VLASIGCLTLFAVPATADAHHTPGACSFDAATGELTLLGGNPPVTTGTSADRSPYETFSVSLRNGEYAPTDRRLAESCGAGDATFDDVRSIRAVAHTSRVQLVLADNVYANMAHPKWHIDATDGVALTDVSVALSYGTRAKPYTIAPVTATGPQSLDVSGDGIADIAIPAGTPWIVQVRGSDTSAFSGVVDLRKMNSPKGMRNTIDMGHFSNTLPSTIYGPRAGADVNIVTSNGRDRVTTYGGNDHIDTRGGNDRVSSGAGIDSIGLGLGNDIAYAGPGHDRVYGDSSLSDIGATRRQTGNDTVYGGTGTNYYAFFGGVDRVVGGPGRDMVRTRWSNARLKLGAGNDAVEYDPARAYYKDEPSVMNGQVINCGPGRGDILTVIGTRFGKYRYRKQPGCEIYTPRLVPWRTPAFNDGTDVLYYCSRIAAWCRNHDHHFF
jgi:hypothetical protein